MNMIHDRNQEFVPLQGKMSKRSGEKPKAPLLLPSGRYQDHP